MFEYCELLISCETIIWESAFSLYQICYMKLYFHSMMTKDREEKQISLPGIFVILKALGPNCLSNTWCNCIYCYSTVCGRSDSSNNSEKDLIWFPLRSCPTCIIALAIHFLHRSLWDPYYKKRLFHIEAFWLNEAWNFSEFANIFQACLTTKIVGIRELERWR